MMTLPFSALINHGFDRVQEVLGLADAARAHAETLCTVFFGVLEFYFVGFFIEKDFMPKKPS